MNKHTMQEWADFTGCCAVKDKYGVCMQLFTAKPRLIYRHCYSESKTARFINNIEEKLVSDFEKHDWTVIVYPHNCNLNNTSKEQTK